jgi:acetyltransferase-like isoleucine patch superfamily enzyme
MGKSTLGHRTYGSITMRGAATNLTVGKYCSLASGIIADGGFNHNSNFVSTFPFAVALQHVPNLSTHIEHKGDINIGNDVWIGEDVLLMSGVTIGDGAVIGIRSIITKDVAPYSIVVGANRFIRKRFTDEQIKKLLALKWWDFPDEEVDKIAHLLSSKNIDELVSLYP